MKKTKIIYNDKNFFFFLHNGFGLLPKCIVKKKMVQCIAIQGSVLQEVAGLRGFVLQEGKVYCNLGIVGWELYLRILHCIAIEGAAGG